MTLIRQDLPNPQVMIVMRDGKVHEVIGDQPLTVVMVEYHNDPVLCSEKDPYGEPCEIGPQHAEVNPERITRMIRAEADKPEFYFDEPVENPVQPPLNLQFPVRRVSEKPVTGLVAPRRHKDLGQLTEGPFSSGNGGR